MTIATPETEIRPISHWSTNDKAFALVRPFLDRGARIVDVGAGEGFFSKKMGDYIDATGDGRRATGDRCVRPVS